MNAAGNFFEIVSADSVQVYKFLNIGSGKPDKEDLKKVPHHLIDVVEPDYNFTAGNFVYLANKACETIRGKDKLPLFVGGTGLYIDAFFKGLSHIPQIDQAIRDNLAVEIEEKGNAVLYNELRRVDPDFALKVHPNDTQRIMRGIQVFRGTGRSLSSYFNEIRGAESEHTLYIGVSPEKLELHQRIDLRVDSMLKRGFVDEVFQLRANGYKPQLASMKTIGYAEINNYLDDLITYSDAVKKIKNSTKKYAKKQITWFQRNKKIMWFNPEDVKKITYYIEKWLNY